MLISSSWEDIRRDKQSEDKSLLKLWNIVTIFVFSGHITMDAIRKKMQSLKAETDGLYATIQRFEDATKDYNRQADQVIISN